MDRLFNYNLYEHTRWGAGLRYIYSFDRTPAGRQLWADIYGAYGVNDKRFKFGTAISFKAGGPRQTRVGLNFVDDIEQAASRQLESYTLTNLSANSSYMAIRFSHIQRLALTTESHLAPRFNASASLRYSREEYLFKQMSMVFPQQQSGSHEPQRHFAELSVLLNYNNRAKLSILTGITNLPYSPNGGNTLFLRAIAQYNYVINFANLLDFSIYGQAGVSTTRTPYSRMFDLGGTYGSSFYFSNAFLTLQPAELAANNYLQLCLRLSTSKPLWNLDGYSKPKLYFQANTCWGMLWDGSRLSDATYSDGLTLYAPDKGLMELSGGVTNLLCFNGIYIGFAAAYQIAPSMAGYYRANPADRIAYLSSATLIF